MLRMKRVATIAASSPPVLREYGTDRLKIFFLLGFYRFYGTETKYMKAFIFKFFSRFCFLVLTQKETQLAARIADCRKPRYLYLGDRKGEC